MSHDFEEAMAGYDRIINDKALQRDLLDAGLLTPTPQALHDVDWWQRQLSGRNGSDVLMAEFVVQMLGVAQERAAKAAEDYAERLKHTSHADGLGMGWQAGEALCREIAARIRTLSEPKP